MGFRRWVAIAGAFIAAVFALLVAYLPSPLDNPQEFRFLKAPSLEGPLSYNNKLQSIKRLYESKVNGPESFAVDEEGNFYTGLGDGRIVQFRLMSNGDLCNMTFITRTGIGHPKCFLGKSEWEHICGRPNGVRLKNKGSLYVSDAYKGLLKVQIPLGIIDVLLPAEIGFNGVPFKYLNGLEVSSNGLVYFTESSSKWDHRLKKYDILELNSLGRLMVYDPKTKRTSILLTDLYFANGIALSKDESYILINELSTCRIIKHFLTGPKKGLSELFVENLPGFPDNIRLNSKGNFYVGLRHLRYSGNLLSQLMDYAGPWPNLRKFIAKFLPLHVYDAFVPKHAMVVEINPSGEIVSSLQDPTGENIWTITDAFEHNKNLYIGSYDINYIGKISLEKIPS